MIWVKIKGMRQSCLIDSGSKVSIISERAVKRHRLQEISGRGSSLTLFGADGNPIQVKAEADIDFEVNGFHMNSRFKIVRKLVHEMIIGMDVLTEHCATIDLINGLVYFGDHSVGTHFSPDCETHVTTTKTVVIPPFSEAIVVAKIDSNYQLQTSIIEKMPNLYLKRLVLARCVVSPTDRLVNTRVLNSTSATVYLKRKSKIGIIAPCTVENVNNVNTVTCEASGDFHERCSENETFKSPEDILDELGD